MNEVVLKSHRIPKQPGLAEGQIILREWRAGEEWATHFYNLEDGGYYHGHYFNSLEAGEADFEERVQQEAGCVALTEVVQGGAIVKSPSESITVPIHVLEGLQAVRDCSTGNMLDIEFVRVQAAALGYSETAEWIEANLELYAEGIYKGFEADQL